MRDCRKEFIWEEWRQGTVFTKAVQIPGAFWRSQGLEDMEEKKAAFAHFYDFDEGRSRKFVYRYKNATECKKAVDEHNKALPKRKAMRDLLLGKIERPSDFGATAAPAGPTGVMGPVGKTIII